MIPSLPPCSSRMARRNGVIGRNPSTAPRAAASRLRPSRAPLPSSPSTSPQPPICRITPDRCDAKTDPVPMAATMPSRSPSAPFTAVMASVSIRSRGKGSAARNPSAAPAALAPASPSPATSSGRAASDPVASVSASRAARRIFSLAVARSLAMLAGPATPLPRTRPDRIRHRRAAAGSPAVDPQEKRHANPPDHHNTKTRPFGK
jgi:hypothetical protein